MFERVIAYEAWCDEPGCSEGTEMYLPPRDDGRRMAQARESATADGWTITASDYSYCPKHRSSLANSA